MSAQTDPRPIQTRTTEPSSRMVPAPSDGVTTYGVETGNGAARTQRQLFLRQWRESHPER